MWCHRAISCRLFEDFLIFIRCFCHSIFPFLNSFSSVLFYSIVNTYDYYTCSEAVKCSNVQGHKLVNSDQYYVPTPSTRECHTQGGEHFEPFADYSQCVRDTISKMDSCMAELRECLLEWIAEYRREKAESPNQLSPIQPTSQTGFDLEMNAPVLTEPTSSESKSHPTPCSQPTPIQTDTVADSEASNLPQGLIELSSATCEVQTPLKASEDQSLNVKLHPSHTFWQSSPKTAGRNCYTRRQWSNPDWGPCMQSFVVDPRHLRFYLFLMGRFWRFKI